MRTLQRLRHHEPVLREQRATAWAEKKQNLAQQERRVWIGRLRLALKFCLPVVILWLGLRLHAALFIAADALVVGATEAVYAPAPAHVVEVYCKLGQRVARGEPLALLAASSPGAERDVLVERLRMSELRLQLHGAGGELGLVTRPLAENHLLEAEREVALAEDALLVAEIAREQALQTQVAFTIEASNERLKQATECERAKLALAQAEAQLAAALAGIEPTQIEAKAAIDLHARGLISARDRAAAAATLSRSEAAVASAQSIAQAAALAVSSAETAGHLLEQSLAEKELAHATALERADRERMAAARRIKHWGESAAGYRHAQRGEPISGAEQARHERALLETAVSQAQAEISAWDEAHGNILLRAPAAGVIDGIHIRAGDSLSGGTVLIEFFAPERLQLVAYATPEIAAKLAAGMPCDVLCNAPRGRWETTIRGIARSPVACPPLLPADANKLIDLRVPVEIELPLAADLAPNCSLQVFFPEARSNNPTLDRLRRLLLDR